MAWSSSDRRSRLPADWSSTVRRIKARDGHRCTFKFPNGGRCPITEGLEVDHVEPSGSDADDNLRTLCKRHHAMKSAKEGHAAKAAKKAEVRKKFRRSEAHPGLLPDAG